MAAIPIMARPFGSRAFVGIGSELSLRPSPSVSIFFGSVPVPISVASSILSPSVSAFVGSVPIFTSSESLRPSLSVSATLGSVP